MNKRRATLVLALLMTFILSMGAMVSIVGEEDGYAWVLVETKRHPIPEAMNVNKAADDDSFWKTYGFFDGDTIDVQVTGKGTAGAYGSTDYSKPTDLHGRYTWTDLPGVIQGGQKVTIRMTQEVVHDYRGGYFISLSPYAKIDGSDLKLGYGTSSSVAFKGTYPDGTQASKMVLGGGDEQFQSSTWVDMSVDFYSPRTEGTRVSAYIGVYSGGAGSLGTEYVYEWKENKSKGEAFDSGVRLKWEKTNGLGYRVYRSTDSSSLGISVTDFYITSESYADVNVLPNTTYYYTVKPILAEADPFNGVEEKLGATIATYVLTTKADIYKSGSYKNFLMLQLDNPILTKNGVDEEIDPGRGTTPIIITGRTMIPIRSVVEAIGGTIEWEGTARKITLNARGNKVEMWVDKTDLMINGVSAMMDVAPTIKNGRTFVPVRFAAENLNCKVDWINSTKEVVIVYEE